MQIPTKAGQICQIIHPLADENPDEVYIVAEDPILFGPEDTIYIVSLKELQRNISNPQLAEQIAIIKNEVSVIADSLESYISSWNQPA